MTQAKITERFSLLVIFFRSLLFFLFFGLPQTVWALDLLPYSTRTLGYSTWGTTPHGDIRTVGMAGASVGLADSFISALNNPAGLAMTVGGADFQFTSNTIYNGNIQSDRVSPSDFGLAVNYYPWGFSLGTTTPSLEGQEYGLPTSPTTATPLSISVREYHLSVARVFMENQWALGAGLNIGQSSILSPSTQHTGASFGAFWGATYQLPHRILLGISYRMPMTYGGNPTASSTIPGFFQSIESPQHFGLGVGWIPNRLFKADFSVLVIGTHSNTALLKDENQRVGEFLNLQPRLGVAYTLIHYKELTTLIYLGTYYEHSRIRNAPDRFHGTLAFQINPWILNFGLGVDTSYQYNNYLFSIGLDVIKTMEKLNFIPKLWHPHSAGFAPSITHLSDEGLPRPLVKNWKPEGPQLNPIQVGMELPGRVEKEFKKIGQGIASIFKHNKKKKKKKRAKPKKKKSISNRSFSGI